DKFAIVANLKTAGAYYDGDTKTLFLIGRTKTEPRSYYYRKHVDNGTWTPWERIDLAIKADIVSPIFAFGRLFLFWVERQRRKQDDDPKLRGIVKFSYYDFLSRWAHPQNMSLQIRNDPNSDDAFLNSQWEKFFNSTVYPYAQPKYIRVAT